MKQTRNPKEKKKTKSIFWELFLHHSGRHTVKSTQTHWILINYRKKQREGESGREIKTETKKQKKEKDFDPQELKNNKKKAKRVTECFERIFFASSSLRKKTQTAVRNGEK